MALGVNFFRAGEEIAPHAGRGGEFGQGLAESLDGQPAVIAKAFQLGDRLADLRMATPRRAAIILADVDVIDVALGIGSDQRHPLLPSVPTLTEAKAGKVNVDMWYGIFAPKNTPPEIVQALNKEIKTILASEEIQKAFQPQGMDPSSSTPEEFGKLVERDATRWADLIKAQNIKGE